MIIHKTPKVNRHAVVRFRERVIPWDKHMSNATIVRLIQNLTRWWSLTVEQERNYTYRVRTPLLRFYYDLLSNEITTILPYRELDEDRFFRWINYYNIPS